MPNNRNAHYMGSFSNSFRGEPVTGDTNDPIMAFMGENGEAWGGPITVADFGYGSPTASAPTGTADFRATMVSRDLLDPNVYGGTALYYAWAVPIFADANRTTPVRLRNTGGNKISNGDEITFQFLNDADTAILGNFMIEGRRWRLIQGNGLDMRSWAVFPTIRLPLLIKNVVTTGTGRTIRLKLAPGTGSGTMQLGTLLGAYVDIHAVQACRLYVNEDRELIQEIFSSGFRDSSTSSRISLASNVVGLWFRFDKDSHLLTMYVAVRGEEEGGNVPYLTISRPAGWPASAPPIPEADRRRRITVQNMTWRIRN